ncbi:MAG: CvpA family protein [Bacteroidales bacterium]|nr:CvpA family protein [Bacteroidales bacterium]
MNFIDIIIIIPLLWSAYKGFSKGLIITVASLAALILGIFGAIKFSDFTSQYLIENFDFNPDYLPIISFALTFVLIVIGVHLIARLLDKLVKAVALGFLNRISGLIFGIIKTAFIISIILVVLNGFDKNLKFISPETKENSILYKPLSSFAPLIFPYLDFKNIKMDEEHKNKLGIDV